MKNVFVVQHVRVIVEDYDEVKMIGIYDSMEAAKAAVNRLRIQPGFQDFPGLLSSDGDQEEGFSIDEYEIGKDHWVEGFVIM